MYCVGWSHAPWLLYWRLCWNVAAAGVVNWQIVDKAMTTRLSTLPWEGRNWWDFRTHQMIPVYTTLLLAQQGFEDYTMRYKMSAFLLPRQPPPTSSRKVTIWLVCCLAGQEPPKGKKWPQTTRQPGWDREVTLLHLEGQSEMVSGWILPHL